MSSTRTSKAAGYLLRNPLRTTNAQAGLWEAFRDIPPNVLDGENVAETRIRLTWGFEVAAGPIKGTWYTFGIIIRANIE